MVSIRRVGVDWLARAHGWVWEQKPRNFGPLAEDHFPVEDLLKIAIEIWGSGDYEKIRQNNQPHEAGLLKLDISKTMNELGWKPKWTAKEAIDYTISWYKKFKKNDNTQNCMDIDLSCFKYES